MNGPAIDMAAVKERYGDWDRYIALCDEVTGFAGDEKERAQEAFRQLRAVLGEGFLKGAIQQRHPLFRTLLNNTRVTRLQLTRFAEALGALREARGFDEVLRYIKKARRFAEGESMLDVAFQFFRAGFKVAFEPQVTVTLPDGRRAQKRPDLSILNEETGEEIIVEVSALERSAAFRQSFDDPSFVTTLLFRVLGPARLTMYARMSEAFSAACMDETFQQLKELADGVVHTGEFGALVNEYIEAGIAPEDNLMQLERWAAERGISPGITGPPIYFDEVARTRMKIRDKLAQLPEDRPGIVAIHATASMLFHFHDIRLIIATLGEEVSRYPKLWGVVLSHSYWSGERSSTGTVTLAQHAIVYKTLADAVQKQAIILINEACSSPVTNATRMKIERAFA